MRRTALLLSYALVAAGAILLFRGSRDLLGSRLGQLQAAEKFGENDQRPASFDHRPRPSLHLGDVMARLRIPRLHARFYVVEGDGAAELRRGPGHMPGTAMPGRPGNCVIAGHRDTHFRVLKDIRPGDQIILEAGGTRMLYRVRHLRIVWPNDTGALQPTQDSELHLITCYPFYYVGAAPKRFVVEAHMARPVVAAERPPGSPASILALGRAGS